MIRTKTKNQAGLVGREIQLLEFWVIYLEAYLLFQRENDLRIPGIL